MPHALRTRFKKEIVAEFLPPANIKKSLKRTGHGNLQRVVIICDGMPRVPSRASLLQFFSKKGFWVIYPRYRGSWESDGKFLQKEPNQDVIDIIDQLPHGFTSLWDGKKYRVEPDEIFIIAPSFGGPAGILASRDPQIKKVVCISPVVDWRVPSKAEPIDWFKRFVHDAFGGAYRFGSEAKRRAAWKKLAAGKFYNPVFHANEIDGSKLLIFHARDDETVRSNEVARFAQQTGATLKLFKTGGHLSSGKIIYKHWPQIAKFLRAS